jgi:hypothetical protein
MVAEHQPRCKGISWSETWVLTTTTQYLVWGHIMDILWQWWTWKGSLFILPT